MSRYDVATIGAKPPHNPETGIIVLDATSPRTLRLVRLARATYTEPRLRQAAGGLNDVQVFGLLFSELAASGLRVGHIVVRLGRGAVRGSNLRLERDIECPQLVECGLHRWEIRVGAHEHGHERAFSLLFHSVVAKSPRWLI